jgi:uncharacterized membrane protein YraQ (UPF0718 family)
LNPEEVETVSIVVVLLLMIAGFVALLMAYLFFRAENAAREKVANALGTPAKPTGGDVHAQSATSLPSDTIKALADLAKALKDLSKPIQAMVIALALFAIAAGVFLGSSVVDIGKSGSSVPAASAAPTR